MITVETSRGVKATCQVTVNSPAASIEISEKNLDLFTGKSAALIVSLAPGDVTILDATLIQR